MSSKIKSKYNEFFKLYVEKFNSNALDMAKALDINGTYLSDILRRKRPMDSDLLKKAKKIKVSW